MDREHLPSLNLAVAGALARAGWPVGRLAETLHLPVAFVLLLAERAIEDGEPTPGSDARLLGAVARKLQTPTEPPEVSSRPDGRRELPWLAFGSVLVFCCSVVDYLHPAVSPVVGLALLPAAGACLLMTVRRAWHRAADQRDPKLLGRIRGTGHRATQQRR